MFLNIYNIYLHTKKTKKTNRLEHKRMTFLFIRHSLLANADNLMSSKYHQINLPARSSITMKKEIRKESWIFQLCYTPLQPLINRTNEVCHI